MTDLAAIRARHFTLAEDVCAYDEDPWPCDSAIVLAALDAEKTEWDAACFIAVSEATNACRAAEAREQRLRAAVDGLPHLITDILRKYGGTMKGRGDHDIFDALVRFRAALATEAE